MTAHEAENDVPPGTWDSAPGDVFALDADVTLYWPRVRPCYDAPRTSPVESGQ